MRKKIVIMDLYMPGGDGRELIRELKADPDIKATPVILFSGSDEAIDGEILLAKIRHILKA